MSSSAGVAGAAASGAAASGGATGAAGAPVARKPAKKVEVNLQHFDDHVLLLKTALYEAFLAQPAGTPVGTLDLDTGVLGLAGGPLDTPDSEFAQKFNCKFLPDAGARILTTAEDGSQPALTGRVTQRYNLLEDMTDPAYRKKVAKRKLETIQRANPESRKLTGEAKVGEHSSMEITFAPARAEDTKYDSVAEAFRAQVAWKKEELLAYVRADKSRIEADLQSMGQYHAKGVFFQRYTLKEHLGGPVVAAPQPPPKDK